MRSVYCAGAVRALVEGEVHHQVASIHSVSSGCVSAALLQRATSGDDLRELLDALIARLCRTRWIRPRRPGRVFDLDELVRVVDELLCLVNGRLGGTVPFEVALTHARSGRVAYLDLVGLDPVRRRDALRATMALPFLYDKPIVLDGIRYVDGGLADPLPVLRAATSGADHVIAISSKEPGRTGEPTTGLAGLLLRLAPNASQQVKALMLSRNPLGALTDELLDRGSMGPIRLTRITPSRPELLVARTDRNEGRLSRLERLGYDDARRALDTL
jgi:predicted acylesterase/phospholipase RssA